MDKYITFSKHASALSSLMMWLKRFCQYVWQFCQKYVSVFYISMQA